jgi:hypothetical protein
MRLIFAKVIICRRRNEKGKGEEVKGQLVGRAIFHFPFEISHLSFVLPEAVLLETHMANEKCQMRNGK